MITLPEFVHELDAAGYAPAFAGVFFRFRVSGGDVEREDQAGCPPWEQYAYRQVGTALLEVVVPAALTDDRQGERIEMGSPRALWQLEHRPDFSRPLLLWATQQYWQYRVDWAEAAVKNSASASGTPSGGSDMAAAT